MAIGTSLSVIVSNAPLITTLYEVSLLYAALRLPATRMVSEIKGELFSVSFLSS